MQSGESFSRTASERLTRPIDAEGLSEHDIAVIQRRLAEAVARICPQWLAGDREDLVQTSLLRVLGILRGDRRAELSASYLWKTAYSVVLDELRRTRWRHERTMDEGVEADNRHGAGIDPERAAVGGEIGGHVRACLRGLETYRRRAVLLRLAGYAHDESAERLGMTVKQVANYVHRGMNDLRSCLRGKGLSA